MTIAFTDEILVAYLDGELPADQRVALEDAMTRNLVIRARTDLLRQSALPFAEAFAPMLDAAPKARLEALLAAIPASPSKQNSAGSASGIWTDAQRATASGPAISRRGLIAAAAVCLVAGVALDRALIALDASRAPLPGDEAAEFRAEVAEYLALYTPDTLRQMTISLAKRTDQLRVASERLGLKLDPFAMMIGGLEMRRTQVLEYDGKPLGQIMYLDPNHGPVALCIIPGSTGATKMHREQRSGLNLIYWSSDTHSFVMAARNPMDDLKARADEIRDELADRNQA
jgi:anti-sigma factor RsiW